MYVRVQVSEQQCEHVYVYIERKREGEEGGSGKHKAVIENGTTIPQLRSPNACTVGIPSPRLLSNPSPRKSFLGFSTPHPIVYSPRLTLPARDTFLGLGSAPENLTAESGIVYISIYVCQQHRQKRVTYTSLSLPQLTLAMYGYFMNL